jgi:hypothetical protein
MPVLPDEGPHPDHRLRIHHMLHRDGLDTLPLFFPSEAQSVENYRHRGKEHRNEHPSRGLTSRHHGDPSLIRQAYERSSGQNAYFEEQDTQTRDFLSRLDGRPYPDEGTSSYDFEELGQGLTLAPHSHSHTRQELSRHVDEYRQLGELPVVGSQSVPQHLYWGSLEDSNGPYAHPRDTSGSSAHFSSQHVGQQHSMSQVHHQPQASHYTPSFSTNDLAIHTMDIDPPSLALQGETENAAPARIGQASGRQYDYGVLMRKRQRILKQLTAEISSFPSYTQLGLDPTLHLDHDHWPYSFKFSPHFDPPTDGGLVFEQLGMDQKLILKNRLSQIRPFTPDSIRSGIINRLDLLSAQQLLSNSQEEIKEAAQRLYPINRKKKKAWMTGLDDEQRRAVIQRLAEATQQATDDLLKLFIDAKNPVRHNVALKILNATSGMEIDEIADKYGLRVVESKRNLPWQKGASQIQRSAVLQRMESYGLSSSYCYELFAQTLHPTGFGLVMLKANDEEFKRIMRAFGVKPRETS